METVVTMELLKEALVCYDRSIERMLNNPPEDINSHIDGEEEFNMSNTIIETYYEQNPTFSYHQLTFKDGFNMIQHQVLKDWENDRDTAKTIEQRKELKKYNSYLR